MTRSNTRGFTLIEVLVALVIVGMALPAMLIRMQVLLDNTGYMNTKIYAYWLAENKMQELLITQKLQGNVAKTKKKQDTEEFAGLEWWWRVEIKDTEIPKMYRMEINVGLEEDNSLANVAGFLYEP